MNSADAQAGAGLLTLTPGGMTAVGVLMPIAASTAVTLRFYARRWQRLSLGIDDWTALVAACLVGVLGLIVIVASAIGALGQHSSPTESRESGRWDQGSPTEETAEKIVLAYGIVEKPAYALTKISVLLLYRRIFKGTIFPTVTTASCVLLTAVGLSFLVVSSIPCSTGNWGTWDGGWALQERCVPQEIVTVGFAICDTITNIVILLMPLPVIYNLHRTGASKVGICFVVVSGLLPLIVSIVRLAIVCFLAYSGIVGYRDVLAIISTDTTLSLVEAGTAIVAACIPTLRNLVAAGIGLDSRQGIFESRSIRINDSDGENTKSTARDKPPKQMGLSMITEEIEPDISPTSLKGSFGGAYPLQKISDVASTIASPPSRGTEKSAAISETENLHSVLRHYDQLRQCWQ